VTSSNLHISIATILEQVVHTQIMKWSPQTLSPSR
jgi:hypothetical protein